MIFIVFVTMTYALVLIPVFGKSTLLYRKWPNVEDTHYCTTVTKITSVWYIPHGPDFHCHVCLSMNIICAKFQALIYCG